MSKRKNVQTGKPFKRLEARINPYTQRGSGKIADTMHKPGSQNRKK